MSERSLDSAAVGAIVSVDTGRAVAPSEVLRHVTIVSPEALAADGSASSFAELVALLERLLRGAGVKDANPADGWLGAVPRCLRADARRAADYLCMLVAIDFRHWDEAVGSQAAVGAVVAQKNFWAAVEPASAAEGGAPKLVRGSAAMVHLLREAVDVRGVHWYDTRFVAGVMAAASEGGGIAALDAVLRPLFVGVADDGVTPMEMPATAERIQLIGELSAALEARQTSFSALLQESGGEVFAADGASGFVQRLVALHPRYDDTAHVRVVASGERARIHLLKLAQLTVMALRSTFPAEFAFAASDAPLRGAGAQLSVCSDYQLPKALRAAGLIVYDAHLARLVDERRLLAPDSQEEHDIRIASTISAAQLLAFVKARGGAQPTPPTIDDVVQLDFALWFFGRSMTSQPHHLCRTTMY